MTTATPRWGFPQINPAAGGDNVDVVNDFNVPWASVDTLIGQECTSTTRPAAPVEGQTIFESDTGFTRVYTGTAWKITGSAVASSGSMPAHPIEGDVAYVSDVDQIARYTGAAWRYIGMVACSSTTHPATNISTGTQIYETDTLAPAVYTGSTWSYLPIRIAIQNISTTTASVTFSSIPTYTNLLLTWKARGDTAAAAVPLELQLNGNTSSTSYIYEDIEANGASLSSKNSNGTTNAIQVATMTAASANSGYYGCGQIFFPNASDNTNHQVCFADGYAPMTASTAYRGVYSGLASTGVVSSITLFPLTGNFSSGVFCLYGLM